MLSEHHLALPAKRIFPALARTVAPAALIRQQRGGLSTFRPGPGGEVVESDNTRYHRDSVCFGCGPANPYGLNMHSYRVQETGEASVPEVVSLWRAEPGMHQGYHGIVHGGVLGALVDCLGCWTVTSHVHAKARAEGLSPMGNVTMTMGLTVKFKKPTLMPLEPLSPKEVHACGSSACAAPDATATASRWAAPFGSGKPHEVTPTPGDGGKHANFWSEPEPEWVGLLPASTLLMTSAVVPDASQGKKFRVESRVHDLYQLGPAGANILRDSVAAIAGAPVETRFDLDVALLNAVVTQPGCFFGASSNGLDELLAQCVTVESSGDFFHKADVATHAVKTRQKVLGLIDPVPQRSEAVPQTAAQNKAQEAC